MSEQFGSLDLQDLKETFLECSVCLETFNQADKRPRLLEFCLHAFCTECLERLLAEEGKKQITCPMCRRVQRVKAVKSLPVDPVRNKLVDYVRLKNKKQVLCTACGNGNAISRCEDCKSYLCNECHSAHKRQIVTKRHTVVSLEQVLAQPITSLSERHICPKHESYKMEYYCTSDEQLCCVSCTVLDHKGHDLIGLEEAEVERRAEVETLLANVSKKARDMREAKEQMTKQQKQLVETKAKSMADIDSMFDTLRQALEQRKAGLVASLDVKSAQLMTSIQKSADALDQSLAVIESTETYYTEAKGKADVVEMLTLYPAFKRSLEGIDEEKPLINLADVFSVVIFQKKNQQQTLNDIRLCGDLDKGMREDDAPKTFNEFASSPHGDSGRTSSREKRDGKVGSERLEALGAVGGRAYDDWYNSGQYSFSSTFAGQESMLRDLDRVPKDELTEVQKWLDSNDKIGDDETLRLKLMQVKLDTEEERTTGYLDRVPKDELFFWKPRSPRSETKQKPVRRTSSLTRDPRSSPRHDTDIRRTEDRPEDKESNEFSLKPVPRPRSGRVSSRPQSSGAATYSGSGKKTAGALKPDFPKTMSDFRKNNSSSSSSCPICMEPLLDPFKLDKCGHVFCKSCIRRAFDNKPVCPICGMVYGVLTGDQPSDGKMTYFIQSDLPIPGYRDARGTIVIDYKFPSGTQQAYHPNPGRRYSSLHRTAYLPNNAEGKEVLKLLKKAFQNRLTFTIGESRTTGMAGVLTWNDIHHKTNLTGGVDNFGYPDPNYLKRVKEDLAAKGITS